MMNTIRKLPKEIPIRDIHEVLYSALLQNTSDSFTIIDRNYQIIWNNQFRGDNQVVGKECYEVTYNRISPCTDPNCVVKNIFNRGKVCMNEKCIHRQDGTKMWKEVRAYPVFDNQGHIVYSLNIGIDITDKRLDLEKQKRYVQYLEKSLSEMAKKQNNANIISEIHEDHVNLTKREIEVLRLIAEGFTNVEIAMILAISRHTVKSHVVHVCNKLGVNDRTQAAVQATRRQLI